MAINFASENYAGAHTAMIEAISDANTGYEPSYGNDAYTKAGTDQLKEIFGEQIEAYFTFNGTGANNFGIGAVAERWHSVFCSDVAHLYVDESTAPEAFTGCRLYPVKSAAGKIIPSELEAAIKRKGDIHHPQPGLVSITQPTEYGTVYSMDELKAIKAICRAHDLLLHADGARYFNAAASLNISLKEMTAEAGIDVLTLGGTKAGMLFGEAVIFFKPDASGRRRYHLKRSMQLASKNRFIAVQFSAMFKGELWKHIAAHTNGLAKAFESLVAEIPGISITRPVETNMVFLKMDVGLHQKLQQHASFYYWNEQLQEVRLVFSFDSKLAEVEEFVRVLKAES